MRKTPLGLAAREQQLVDAVQAAGEATVQEVLDRISEPPSYSAVRAMLNILVDKSVLTYRKEGRRYVYRLAIANARGERTGLRRLVDVTFGGRANHACLALLDMSKESLSEDDLSKLEEMIQVAKRERS